MLVGTNQEVGGFIYCAVNQRIGCVISFIWCSSVLFLLTLLLCMLFYGAITVIIFVVLESMMFCFSNNIYVPHVLLMIFCMIDFIFFLASLSLYTTIYQSAEFLFFFFWCHLCFYIYFFVVSLLFSLLKTQDIMLLLFLMMMMICFFVVPCLLLVWTPHHPYYICCLGLVAIFSYY